MPDPARLAALRREYAAGGLSESQLADSWHAQLTRWVADAVAAQLWEINAVVLATATPQGRPSARHVLLKGYDERGLVVYTNYDSDKGRELAANPQASLVVPWVPLERQVLVCGVVSRISRPDSEAYFRSRPRGAQLSAWASAQSTVVGSREELERRWSEVAERFQGAPVPLPDFWGGLRLEPASVEFWQGRTDRLHDRLRFRRDGDRWVVERLAP